MSSRWLHKLKRQPFFIRLGSWEYWPMHLLYIPVYLYWLILSIRARAFMFFAAANPAIPLGGLYGESKWEIMKLIPERWLPKTLFIPPGTPISSIRYQMASAGIHYPVIVKPDQGERGFLVEKVDTPDQLRQFLSDRGEDFLVQEYVDGPVEVSVLYYRLPGESRGQITSLTLKDFLTLVGDGRRSLRELIMASARARLQLEVLENDERLDLDYVPAAGEHVQPVPIGNHCRGTTFLNGEEEIDEALLQRFDLMSQKIEGIFFGRFDIRCASLDALRAGRDFRILEINGVKSEPTHIYHPGYSLLKAYRVLFRQWSVIYRISRANRRRGVAIPSLWTGIVGLYHYTRYKHGKIGGNSPEIDWRAAHIAR